VDSSISSLKRLALWPLCDIGRHKRLISWPAGDHGLAARRARGPPPTTAGTANGWWASAIATTQGAGRHPSTARRRRSRSVRSVSRGDRGVAQGESEVEKGRFRASVAWQLVPHAEAAARRPDRVEQVRVERSPVDQRGQAGMQDLEDHVRRRRRPASRTTAAARRTGTRSVQRRPAYGTGR
jgi:hypothetical protein